METPTNKIMHKGEQQQQSDSRTAIEHVEISDSTLREGEQYGGAYFTFDQKLQICLSLTRFGVEYIEMTLPVSNSNAADELHRLVSALRSAKSKSMVLARCHPTDVELALKSGTYGINLFMGTSSYMQKASHGKSLEQVTQLAADNVKFLKSNGCQFVSFCAEDAFRTDIDELLYLSDALNDAGVDRMIFADTVGGATPFEVYKCIHEFSRRSFNFQIEFHGHNDTGCAVANAYAALEGGAHCIDTCVLGIGERNGICSLSGLIARLQTLKPTLLTKYDLKELPKLDALVANILGIPIPHDMPITAPHAFTHKAGVHVKAMLADPHTYEIIQPGDFGIERTLVVASKITGKHAVAHRAMQLSINTLTDDQILLIAEQVRIAASIQPISLQTVDQIIKSFLSK
ncbi:unnamed protein product [Rotaria sp. Silwood1]|nr:unnamed protein product [Rotaria sp. Silwood1]CAF3659257.1 unnamed protein product [Rotaria sp. Silwood1]CAF3671201.1 unnamed protein product [Rotaria sp. Silwood1]CAF4797267.1 unnamed protein product [Rotaria sp. Silwood1]CAF4913387.1 unnamed protein product [Rotaria sp. Silwood1]